MPLTPKQARFVSEYLIDLNATQAAIRAGYSPKTAQEQSSRLLSKPIVASAVQAGQSQCLHRLEITADRVKARMAQRAFADVRKLYDAQGKLRPIHELTPDEAAIIAGIETVRRNVDAADGVTDTVYKVKLIDQDRSLDMLAKHFGLLTEKVEHSGVIELTWKQSK